MFRFGIKKHSALALSRLSMQRVHHSRMTYPDSFGMLQPSQKHEEERDAVALRITLLLNPDPWADPKSRFT